MSRGCYFVKDGGGMPKAGPQEIQRLGDRYAGKAEGAASPRRPSGPPAPLNGVEEGTPASASLPKEKCEPAMGGWALIIGHGV